MNKLRCPQCGLSHIKRNGLTHYGKQNYRCKDCDRQFVEDSQRIGEELKDLIKVLLLERLSLRGICRVTGVSLTWLLHFITERYCALPDDLNVTLSQARKSAIRLVRLEAEADEIWSFAVSKKTSNGSGSRLTSGRNRSLPFMSEIVQPPALENCGNAFRKFTGTTQLSIRMAWQPIKRCYPQRGIKLAPRVRGIRTS